MNEIKLSAKEVTFWKEHAVPSEPHQNHIPFIGLFRPLSCNNHYWLNYWPELEI